MIPVAGTAHLLELALDDIMMLLLYLPCTLDELLTAEVLTPETFLLKLPLYNVLRCDASMISSRNPESRTTMHPVIPDDYILQAVIERMPHVKNACDIRWWHDD